MSKKEIKNIRLQRKEIRRTPGFYEALRGASNDTKAIEAVEADFNLYQKLPASAR